jgi:HEAT repeat protein
VWGIGIAVIFGTSCPDKGSLRKDPQEEIWKFRRQLRSDDAQQRKQAAEGLGAMGADGIRALPSLRQAINDPEPDVKRAVVRALGQMGKEAVPALIEFSVGKDEVVSKEAKTSFEQNYGGQRLEVLKEVMRHPFWKVRWGAVKLLSEMRDQHQEIVPLLVTALQDEETDVRKEAAIALRKIGLPHAVNAASVKTLADGLRKNAMWWPVRIEMAQTLGSFGEKAAAAGAALVDMLGDKDEAPRKQAVATLKQIGTAALPAMMQGLSSGTWQIKVLIAEILEHLGPKAAPAVAALSDALSDEDIDVRRKAIAALTAIGEAAGAAAPALNRMIRSDATPQHLWVPAVRCLFVLGQNGQEALQQILKDRDWSLRRKLMETMGKLGADVGPQAVPFLRDALQHQEKEVKWIAAMVLSKLQAQAAPALDVLLRALEDRDPTTRKWAALAIGAIGSAAKTAMPNLQKLLRDPDPSVRESVERAIAIIEGKIPPPIRKQEQDD